MVDTHVHINEPGRTEWEGFSTATERPLRRRNHAHRDAVEQHSRRRPPLPPIARKLAARAGKLSVDIGFWGGVVPAMPANCAALGSRRVRVQMLPGAQRRRRVRARDEKRSARGIARVGRPGRSAAGARGASRGRSRRAAQGLARKSRRRKHTHVARLPPREAEDAAIALAHPPRREFKARVHIVHLSSSDSHRAIAASEGGRTRRQRRDVPSLSDIRRRGNS